MRFLEIQLADGMMHDWTETRKKVGIGASTMEECQLSVTVVGLAVCFQKLSTIHRHISRKEQLMLVLY